MRRKRGLVTLIAIILFVVAPTAASLISYKITGNPLFRPLGITQAKIQAYAGFGGGVEILAIVAWDPSHSGQITRADMTRALTRSFRVKGVSVRVVYRPSSSGTWISYKVGASAIGPYPQERAAEGIGAAVEAYRMLVPLDQPGPGG